MKTTNWLRRPGVWAVTSALLLGGFAFAGSSAADPNDAGARQSQVRIDRAPTDDGNCDKLASASPSTSDSGLDVQRIIQRGKLIAGIDTNSYLWGSRDPDNGTIQGFDIDLVRALAAAILGDPNKVQLLAVPTDQRIPALQKGLVDVVVRTFTHNCAREKQVSFSADYFTTGQQILVPKGSQVTGLNDGIKGQRICTATGSTAEALLQGSPYKSQEVKVANQLDCLVLMQLGQVDATITDGALAVSQQAQDHSLRILSGQLDTEYYGIAVKLGSTDLVARINAVLQSYIANGDWQQSYDKWLKSHTGQEATPPPAHYR
ncbi:glutamate ABC transporter substrate-binding protein [Streptacidiphilus jiangxiensis]|uniref:Polar amino acid transport system substrate-binding protein n=1 Tax=Streptacidiphilus jiangxiensis TaxID=235985 RepID=A0A1H7S4B5_STRJI|nr:glutamate ABC transporter substrate-binding protein [Streptacidiphilus jiangxiensis]SEL66594.1 polar amino acid transport system substrate-binding protein [Streptacidiphilus jiangxiensis]